MFLRTSRQSFHTRRRRRQCHLSRSPPGQARQHATASLVPLGQLLLSDGVWIVARVETLEEGGGSNVCLADVECPGDEGAVLVCVQDDVGGCLEGDYLLEFLGLVRKSCLERCNDSCISQWFSIP